MKASWAKKAFVLISDAAFYNTIYGRQRIVIVSLFCPWVFDSVYVQEVVAAYIPATYQTRQSGAGDEIHLSAVACICYVTASIQ